MDENIKTDGGQTSKRPLWREFLGYDAFLRYGFKYLDNYFQRHLDNYVQKGSTHFKVLSNKDKLLASVSYFWIRAEVCLNTLLNVLVLGPIFLQ